MTQKILIVASTYYKDISDNLIKGSTEILEKNNINYDILYTKGAFEIPFLINQNLKSNNSYDGFITLGCIIRGETIHFELIANEVTRKIMDLSTSFNKPIGFGILTCENLNQAIERSHPDKKNKGAEAVIACIDLLNYKR
tara:strand:- start:176 stop:595 length:420 start_codon:yes stop_codon:yes gene_type:complete